MGRKRQLLGIARNEVSEVTSRPGKAASGRLRDAMRLPSGARLAYPDNVGLQWIPIAEEEDIGVAALSGVVPPSRLDAGLEALLASGHRVFEAPNVRQRSASGYLAGEDSDRLQGLHRLLEQGIRIIVAARGGYGVARLLSDLPWSLLVESGVTFVGFSDLTALLNPLIARGGAVQVHGPMAAVGLDRGQNLERLFGLLRGELVGRTLFRFENSQVVRSGTARGHAIGGNLTVLCSLLGTPYEPPWDGGVLFLEEVGEPLYRLDRLLTHLRSSGRLRNVKALISGSLRGCRPAHGRAAMWARTLREAAPAQVPVVVGLPFGHGARNHAFPLGAMVEIDTESGQVSWRG